MWRQLHSAAIGMALLLGTAEMACAQGSTTQDPGRITPGNLRTQGLGPSTGSAVGGNRSLGAGDMPDGTWSGNSPGVGSASAKKSGTTGKKSGVETTIHGLSTSGGR